VRHIRRNLGFIYLSIAATMIPYIAIAFFNYEFPALVGGAVGLIFSVIFAKLGWGLDAAEGQSFEILNAGDGKHEGTADALGSESAGPESSAAAIGGRELIRATFPLWGTILILVLTRIPQLGIKALLNISEPAARIGLGSLGQFSISPALGLGLTGIFGTGVSWSHKLLYVPSIIPFGLISLFTFAWYRMDPARGGPGILRIPGPDGRTGEGPVRSPGIREPDDDGRRRVGGGPHRWHAFCGHRGGLEILRRLPGSPGQLFQRFQYRKQSDLRSHPGFHRLESGN
jgi:hypothetical protein